jgi:hypothetical protein
MTIALDQSGSVSILSGTTTATIDITAATTGAWVYLWIALGGVATTGLTVTGFTDVVTQQDEGTTLHYALMRRKKVAGDTTFTANWTGSNKGVFSWASFSGVDATTPDEAAVMAVNGTTSRTVVPTSSATATAANRHALAFFAVRTTTSGIAPFTWTPDAALSEVLDIDNAAAASAPWIGTESAFSAAPVASGAHTYSGTHSGGSLLHDASALLYLIPAAGGGGSTNWQGGFGDVM